MKYDKHKKLHLSNCAHLSLCRKSHDNRIKYNYHDVVFNLQIKNNRILSQKERKSIYNDSVKFGEYGFAKLREKYLKK
ncbi:MAG: hypothetical protein J6A53_02655 [Clostridia bacterium]|nr:hypothetical protein [Clostridia bacterium]